MSQKLTDMQLTRVSLVDKGANARRFAVLKRDEEDAMTGAAAPADDSPAGIAGWLHKAADLILGKADPVVKSAMPTTEAAMRSHLAAKTPGGHGMGDIAVANMSMAAMEKKHTADAAGADHSHAVAKVQTFAAMVAGQELQEALGESWWTLQDALWAAIYACDDMGADLTLEAKQALVAQDLDEFKAYLLAEMGEATSIAKRAGPAELAQRQLAAVIAKAGRKISGARLERLQAASEALNSVLAEVAEVTEEAGADAQEDSVDKADLAVVTEAISKAQAPLVAAIAALAKSGTPAAPAAETTDEPATLDTVVEVVGKLADRLQAIEKRAGERTSIAGQDGGDQVKKRSLFAGIL